MAIVHDVLLVVHCNCIFILDRLRSIMALVTASSCVFRSFQ